MMDIWLRSEFPEVLSWRFDLTRPFDRPWRAWTRSARAMEKQGAMVNTSTACGEVWGIRSDISPLSFNISIYRY
jgi:hypothetical protein